MSKKWSILLAAFFILIAGGLAWLLHQPGEPVYEGKPLSYWLEGYGPQGQFDRQKREKADEVMQHVGTNAIPTLLRMLRANDTPLKLKLVALLDKQHLIKIKHTPAATLNFAAAKGFYTLDADARCAVPALIDTYERKISFMSQYYTTVCLATIGSPAKSAVPALVKDMTNSDMRDILIKAFGQIHSEPELVVPALIETLGDSNSITQHSAFQVLGIFGADAKPAVPTLIKLLKDPDEAVRREAASALIQIDPAAAAKAGINER